MSHARLGPSNHRWVGCPGSIREEAAYPDISGDAAIDGTGSHLLLELCLEKDVPASVFLDQMIGVGHKDKKTGWLVKQDRIDRVQICLDYITRRYDELMTGHPGCDVVVESETKSNPGEFYGRDDWWGTVDITIEVIDTESLQTVYTEIVDYKDGRMFVTVPGNSQLTAYLGGKSHDLESKQIVTRMTIVQPKTTPPIRYVDMSPHFLKKQLDVLADAAAKTDDPEALLVVDSKDGKGYCAWCKHKGNCTAIRELVKGGTDMDIEGKIEEWTDEKLSTFLDTEKNTLDLFKQAKGEATLRLNKGVPIPGYAILPGNSSKEWNVPPAELYNFLQVRKLKKDEIYIPKLISPAQALKHTKLTKKQLIGVQKLIDIVPGKMTLKKVEKTEQSAVDMFSDVVVQCNTDNETEVSFY